VKTIKNSRQVDEKLGELRVRDERETLAAGWELVGDEGDEDEGGRGRERESTREKESGY
jgi:hypothetical protein